MREPGFRSPSRPAGSGRSWLRLAGALALLGSGGSLGACALPADSAEPARVAPTTAAKLRVGVSGDYAPFSTRVASGPDAPADYHGFDADLARRFAEEVDAVLHWVPFRWPDLQRQLARGEFDVAMSGVTMRPERSVAGRFSVPVAETGAVLLVWTEAFARGANLDEQLAALDTAGVRIAVNRGGHLERVTRARFEQAEILAIPDNAAVRDALFEGRVDAVVTDTLEAPRWKGDARGLAVVGPFTRDRKAYLLSADALDTARRLDAWLIAAERDGTLARLRARHFGSGAWPSTADPLSALLAATDERLALMPFVADWKRLHGRAVIDTEREERVLAAAQDAVAGAALSLGVASPPPALVRAFYRAQIDAAVDVQRAVLGDSGRQPREAFDLAGELRPALLRIGERMARLLVRASTLSVAPDFDSRARAALSVHGLSAARQRQIVHAIRAFGAHRAGDADQLPPSGRDADQLPPRGR